jgi:hypothetical protein
VSKASFGREPGTLSVAMAGAADAPAGAASGCLGTDKGLGCGIWVVAGGLREMEGEAVTTRAGERRDSTMSQTSDVIMSTKQALKMIHGSRRFMSAVFNTASVLCTPRLGKSPVPAG